MEISALMPGTRSGQGRRARGRRRGKTAAVAVSARTGGVGGFGPVCWHGHAG
jgi:hypothetical protein